jgi:hypothetical protein
MLFLSLSLSSLFCCSYPPLPSSTHTQRSKQRKKKQNQKKNIETTRMSNKDTRLKKTKKEKEKNEEIMKILNKATQNRK